VAQRFQCHVRLRLNLSHLTIDSLQYQKMRFRNLACMQCCHNRAFTSTHLVKVELKCILDLEFTSYVSLIFFKNFIFSLEINCDEY
jgi:hypothetical protein